MDGPRTVRATFDMNGIELQVRCQPGGDVPDASAYWNAPRDRHRLGRQPAGAGDVPVRRVRVTGRRRVLRRQARSRDCDDRSRFTVSIPGTTAECGATPAATVPFDSPCSIITPGRGTVRVGYGAVDD